MTLHPRYIPDVPETTAQVAKAAFCKGNRYVGTLAALIVSLVGSVWWLFALLRRWTL